jgi:chromosome segregation ATPase
MMRSRVLVVVSLLGSLSMIFGCDRTDDHQKAAAEQSKADEKIGKVDEEARKNTNEAQHQADKEVAEALNTANEKSAKAQTKANETIRAANENMLKARNDLREWAQKTMNEIDNDVDESKTRAQKAPSTAKANFERALQDVEKQRGNVQAELATLDTQAAASMTDYRGRLEKAFEGFKESVNRLDKTL